MSEKTFNISVTNDGVKVFPMHAHDAEEIVLYVEGEGVMRTNERDVKFFPGKILVIPRGIMHGSASAGYFKNVCVYCDFGEIKKVTEVSDTATGCVFVAYKNHELLLLFRSGNERKSARSA